jgi:flagellar motility protein MotE (MotC chaperone)
MNIRLFIVVSSFCVLSSNIIQAEDVIVDVRPSQASAKPDFCRAFANRAAQTKLQNQKNELLQLKSQIEEQLLTLNQKTRELENLVAQRDAHQKAVSNSLVKIYSNVEPEIAAQQLEKLGVEMASEVLQRLNPKISGEIVTAMDVKLASRVVKVMLTKASNQKSEDRQP